MNPGATLARILLLSALLLRGLLSYGVDLSGPEDQYYVVHDYHNDWLVYSEDYDNYVPYTRSLHETKTSVSLLLHLLQSRHYTLLLHSRTESYLFVGGRLQRKILPNQWLALSCDSLYQQHQEADLLLTLYGTQGIDGLTAYMAFPKKEADQQAPASLVSIRPRPAATFQDFSILVSLLITALAAAGFSIAPAISGKLANPLEFFNRDYRSELYYHHRPYSPVIILGELLLSLLIALFLITLDHMGITLLPTRLMPDDTPLLPDLLLVYFKLTGLCFLLCYLKYLLISATDGILKFSNVADFHFIKSVQSSLLFYAFLTVCFALLARNLPHLLDRYREYLLLPVFCYYGIRFLLLYVLINRSKRFINLYLFSYLCVVEIIPLIIGVKFAL